MRFRSKVVAVRARHVVGVGIAGLSACVLVATSGGFASASGSGTFLGSFSKVTSLGSTVPPAGDVTM